LEIQRQKLISDVEEKSKKAEITKAEEDILLAEEAKKELEEHKKKTAQANVEYQKRSKKTNDLWNEIYNTDNKLKNLKIEHLDFIKKQKIEESKEQNSLFPQKLEKTNILTALKQPLEKVAPKEKTDTTKEQKSFGIKETMIDFSEHAKDYLHELLFEFGENLLKKFPKYKQEKSDSSFSLFTLAALAALLVEIKKISKVLDVISKPFIDLEKAEALKVLRESKIPIPPKIKNKTIKPPNLPEGEQLELFPEEQEKNLSIFDKIKKSFNDSKIGQSIDGIIKNITASFSEEGKLSMVTKWFNGFIKIITNGKEFLEKISNVLERIIKWLPFGEKILGVVRFLAEKFPVIDGLINAIKTTIDLFSDKSLSPLQKGIAILSSFIGGISDFIFSLTSLIGQGISGIMGLLTGKGFFKSLDNSFSKWIDDTFRAGGRGTGVQVGQEVADLLRASNIQNSSSEDFYKTGQKYKNASPEERKKMDEEHHRSNGIQNDNSNNNDNDAVNNPIIVPDAIIDAYSIQGTDGKTYKPSPQDVVIASKSDGALVKHLMDLKQIMASVNTQLINMKNFSPQEPANISSVNVASNTSNMGSGSRDPILEARHYYWNKNPAIGRAFV
jgi:hypothetical protein